MTSVESWSSPKYLENFTFLVFNGSDDLSYFNFTANLLVETKRAIISFEVKMKADERKKSYDVEVFRGNVDSCQAGKGISGNYIIKFFMTHLENYSNLKIDCPQKKRFYYAYNFPVPVDARSFIPSFIPVHLMYWQLIIDVKAKVSKTQAADRVLRVQLQGSSV